MNKMASPWDLMDTAFEEPKKSAPTTSAAGAVKDMTPLKGKSVLIVDSALATRRALQEQVSQLGSTSVVFASTVSEVENHLEAREFGLIICEYLLEGDRNGQQLLEELRIQKALPWFTAFMMVTGERTYSNVVSVAEFEPDDYLIKPFTASSLSSRIIRIFTRKNRLAQVYKPFYEEEYDKIPAACVHLEKVYPQYLNELQRMRIESIYRSERFDEAEGELEEAMLINCRPWMQLILGKIKAEKKKFAEAEELLSKVVRENPEYIAATDLFADVLWEQDKPEQALEALEKLGARAVASVTRLRKLADLSLRVGDDSRSKIYLNKVIDRSRNSSLTQMHDYLQLAKIFTKEGRHEEADKLTARLRNAVNSTELDFARTVMSIQRMTSEGSLHKAREKLEALFANEREFIQQLQPDAQTSLLEQCFMVGLSKEGYDLARVISKRRPSKALLDRIKTGIANQKKETD